MKYDFVFTFIVPVLPFSDTEEDVYREMKKNSVKGFLFESSKGMRVITYGSTRRKVERMMWDLNGRHLRTLDDFTFSLLSEYIGSSVVSTTCI